jgi:DNA repair exonuclease SbcCD ATPase subunit
MYINNSIYSFVLQILDNNNINITEEDILRNSIARLDVLIPSPMKALLKKVSKATDTTMTMHVIRAIMEYLEDFNISETEMDLITVKRSEYLEIIEENKELKNKIKEMSKNEEEYNRTIDEIEELKKRLREAEKKNRELERENKKLKNKVERYEKKDPILKLGNILEELLPQEQEFPLSEVFKQLNLTHANDKSKFVNNHIKLNSELSTTHLRVYNFLDDRLSNYLVITEDGLYDGKIILKSKLNDILTKIKEEIEKQKELKRLRQKMKEYRKPIEMELLKIKNRHPELTEPIFEFIGMLSRAENPQQLMETINKLREWLKQYSITISENIIEEISNNIKTEQVKNNKGRLWERLLR